MRDHLFRAVQVSSLALALAGTAGTARAQNQEVQAGANEEIVVTATKREENIRQTPLAISAVTGDQLAAANANSLADYITRMPGVVFNDYQPGISEVVIRGIAATTYHEQGQTTVGYYLNEIPLVEPGFPIGIPDVDTFDIERVEVLRGPQGTLFGSSTLGGLVNYVVKTADTSKFDAAAEGLVGYTKNAGEANYAAKVMVNVPVIKDMLAVRVMALQRFDAGYLDNPGTGVDGSNDFRTRGLRGSIVFTPGTSTKITYLSTYQDTKLDDQTYLDLDHPYIRNTPRAEPQETDFWLNSLRLDQELGFGSLTVLGSIIDKNNTTVFSYPYPYVTGNVTGAGAAYSLGDAEAHIKTVEARLASEDRGMFRWLIGTSYMRATKSSYDQIFQKGAAAYINAHPADFGGFSGTQLTPGDRLYGYLSDTVNEDFGVFGELSIRPIDAFEISFSGRYYSNRYEASVVNQAGALGGYPGGFTPTDSSGHVKHSEDGFTPKVTITARPTGDFMAYMTFSQGYRVGGINPNAGLLPTIPVSYDSDTVNNYEAGIKFSALRDMLYIDASVFSIDWKDIQARLFGPGPSYYSYVTNAGGANVSGVEFSATLQPTRNLSFGTNVTYQDAKLTEFLPDTFAVGGGYASGTPLPGASRWSVANNVKFELAEVPLQPSFEIAHRYLSSALVAFGNPNTRGNFNIVDIRASILAFDRLRILAFANNVFDKYGILNAPFTAQTAPAGSIVRPRTVGVRLDWSL
ncbi:TonB-dependent receptor [Sphingomonas sp. 7/4-4]|uniref:TonB-dependent receptor n=1 Tax=Sphingomonas sp. 7/4-4 TaxID=3018446 RepID=UPI0022F3F6D4|nr:TonB-dependent receptor [Sphingomonas sp. 7/4-4]WBY07830.1 TonB-dependent receptor [Sphingomonas sp. 7/4-4]